MSFLQALGYFLQEASLSLVRSWKVSLVAILTIMVSLFLGGVFLLASGNLEQVISRWRGESKIVVYLEVGVEDAGRERLEERLAAAPWTSGIAVVSAEQAQTRFREAFPSLVDLLEGWGDESLPASLEASLDPEKLEAEAFEGWLEELRSDPAVSMVDDDRDWLEKLEAVVLLINGLGLLLGAVLLGTAVFTISSVIRLTAYLYRDEIAVMRLVGATEFFIRGPFFVEGLLQGIAGGLLAIAALFGSYRLVLERSAESVLGAVLAADFLSPTELAALVGVGGIAGLLGAVMSLKKESLGQSADDPEWSARSENA